MLTNFLLILRNFRLAGLLVRLWEWGCGAEVRVDLCPFCRGAIVQVTLSLKHDASAVALVMFDPSARWASVESLLNETAARLIAESAAVPADVLVGTWMGDDGASELGEGR
jgi:hypothetical protein